MHGIKVTVVERTEKVDIAQNGPHTNSILVSRHQSRAQNCNRSKQRSRVHKDHNSIVMIL